MEEQVIIMDYFNISLKGKKKLVRWLNEQRKLKRRVCASKMIESAQNEHKLMQMMEYIDKWHDEHPTHQEPSGATQEDSDEVAPDSATGVEHEAPANPVFVQKELSRSAKHRVNEFIPRHPDICVSRMILDAANEDDLLRALDEIDNRVTPVNNMIKRWTVRPSRRL